VHGPPCQAKKDARRDTQRKNRGYTVARFSNGIVLEAPALFVAKGLSIVSSLAEAFD
jgi:very-short-patch-repair endonuclease